MDRTAEPADPEAARLLLVEDEPELRGMLGTLLTEEGYRVDGAAAGQRALHLGLTHRPREAWVP